MIKPQGVAVTNEVEYVDEKRKLDPDHVEQVVHSSVAGWPVSSHCLPYNLLSHA
jgi:hypothetical protein